MINVMKRRAAVNNTYEQVGTTKWSKRTEFFCSFVDGLAGQKFFFTALLYSCGMSDCLKTK